MTLAPSFDILWTQQLRDQRLTPLLCKGKLSIVPGLNAVVDTDGEGKTPLLRSLVQAEGDSAQTPPDSLWLDTRLVEQDALTPESAWSQLEPRYPRWNHSLASELIDALQFTEHLGKRLDMLSTGSRRKVALIALLSSGATITCLDQPYSALDQASVQVIREFLQDMSDSTTRAWVVADYEADPVLPWNNVITRLNPDA
jgi:ATPase subunit of ABC transporter with duplicated ATPase domains